MPTIITVTPVAPVKYTLGDVNNDNFINSIDASSVLTFYSLYSINKGDEVTESQKLASDVNKNGTIDASDASNILGYYAYTSTTDDAVKLTLEEFLKK